MLHVTDTHVDYRLLMRIIAIEAVLPAEYCCTFTRVSWYFGRFGKHANTVDGKQARQNRFRVSVWR